MKPLFLHALVFLSASAAFAELRINEFLTSNITGLTTEAQETADWIEIHNAGTDAVDLEGYFLTDDETFSKGDPESFWQFPQITLEAEGYLIVFASGAEASPEGELHANFKLSSGGERLALIAPDGVTILSDFSPEYPEQRKDTSYGYGADGQYEFMPVPTPGGPNRAGVSGFVDDVTFSAPRGFHDEPFSLTLHSDTEGAEIMYTLNDLEPDKGTIFTGPIGETYDGPIEISKTTIVRAVAKKSGLNDSVLRTRTYVFLDDILTQPDEPEGFPAKWGSRTPDYGMDPEVVGPIYSEEEVKAALLAAPSISLVTENDNLFANDGIYTNSQAKDLVNDGIEDKWERPVSIELFGFPHGQTIQANAAIRMQGNASRSPNRVKHNMRVIFRQHYGPGKLRFRLFEDSEVETFNSINLRSNNGDSWIHPGVRLRAQYIRDQWHRYVQWLMGNPNQSQIYAHVYINGLYWGMYHVFERFEASLLSEHFGGDVDDWDALQDTPAFQDIVVNGDDQAFRLTHDLAEEDLTVKENYDELLKYVDVDNQIDYLLINFYSGNQDWDHKNMRYGRRRVPVEGAVGNGWLYFAWDSERAGLNGLNQQSLTLDNTTKRTALGPTALNSQMHENPDYHLRFSDRAVKHLFNGGELTPEGAAKSWNALADLVYEPLIGESARWGDLHVSKPETREGNWQNQLDKENEVWFPGRTAVLLGQLASRGFIDRKPSFPQFAPFGGVVEKGSAVTMKIFNDTIFNPVIGDIHYTLDGTDPRQAGGSLHPDAVKYDKAAPPAIDQTLTMMARVYDPDGGWSPLAEAVFNIAEVPTPTTLTLTEIHYAPAIEEDSELEATEFEYLELHNPSDRTIDLSGVQVTQGVNAVVDDALTATLAPGEFALIVADRAAFQSRYSDVSADKIVAEFDPDTRLANNGERVSLRTRSGHLLHTLRYNDNDPWPELEDDAGQSIAFVGGGAPSIAGPDNWVSGQVGGTPGTANEASTPPVGGGGGLADWLTANGYTSAEVAVGPQGEAALLYYAFGIDDVKANGRLPVSVTADGGQVTLDYQRRSGNADLTWSLEGSPDLKTWSEVVGEVTVSGNAGGLESVRHTATGDMTYWRLKVSTD